MTHKLKFTWIDDTPERAEAWINALDGRLRNSNVETQLTVFAVTDNLLNEIFEKTKEWATTPPDLLMIDHSFSKVALQQFQLHGSSLAHLLRLRTPNIPMVCVSGQSIDSDDFNIEEISEYTYIFDVNKINIEMNLEKIFAIAVDFHKVCFPEKTPVRQPIVDILKAPNADHEALLSILPAEFEGTFVHGTSPHRIASWILNVLMKQPGFLYDSLETATFLGLNETAFLQKAKNLFDACLYKGPFATESQPLWWSSALTDVLYSHLPECIDSAPQEAGRKIINITEANFSRCGVTNSHTPAPDVVAYTDSTKALRKPIRHMYSTPFSDEASSLLGFATPLKIRNDRRNS